MQAASLLARPDDNHASFAGDGVKLAFGRRWDGRIIHISDAERGSACGCACPGCGRKLVAHKGTEVQHHFAHAPLSDEERSKGVLPSCAHGPMTALHAYAQELLNEKKSVVLPPVETNIGSIQKKLRGAESFSFDSALLERMDGETIPDVILYLGHHRMHVEILVTHRCGPEKIAKLVAADMSAIEIDLSGLPRDVPLATLDDAILKHAPRQWLHNRRTKGLREKLEAEIAADEAKAKARRARHVEQLRRTYAQSRERALRAAPLAVSEIGDMAGPRREEILNEATGGEGFFSVHPTVWKAEVVRMLSEGVSPSSAAREFRQRKWIGAESARTRSDDDLLREAGLPPGVEGAVQDFLRFLARQGIAEDQGWRWTFSREHSTRIKVAEHNRRRAEEERLAKEQRHNELSEVVTRIIGFAKSSESTAFDFRAWLSGRCGEGLSPSAMADSGGRDWRDFVGGLRQMVLVLEGRAAPPAQDFGLPVRGALDALHIAHVARKEAERRAAEEAARIALERRLDALVRRSRVAGERLQGWIDAPNDRLRGLSPREAAARSHDEYRRAEELLERQIDEARRKQKWEGELEAKLTALMRSPDKSKLSLTTRGWKLPGDAKPVDYVRDEKTLNECLSLIKQKIGRRG